MDDKHTRRSYTMTQEIPKRRKPETQFETESVDDVAELLDRAARFVDERTHEPTVAEELRDGAEFIREEMSR